MSRTVKTLVFVLVLLVVMAAVTGIAFWTAQYNPEAPNPGLFVDSKKVETPPAMVTIGEYEVPFSIYRHYFLMFKGYYEGTYGDDFYAEDLDGDKLYTLKNAVEVELKNAYTWQKIAQEEGITLGEEDLAEINTTLAEQKESFGAGFEAQLADMFYLDEANYLEVAQLQKLAEKATAEYRAKLEEENGEAWGEEADTLFEEEKLRAKHILIEIDMAAEDPQAAREEALETAEGLVADIRAAVEEGETLEAAFDAVMAEQSDDAGLAENPDGYTFGPGEMVDIFYDTAIALEEGEMADPVLSEAENYSGYHIILRLPLRQKEKDENRTRAISVKVEEAMLEKQEQTQESLAISYPDFYSGLTADSIR